jgi:hypothetical protein
MPTKVGIQVFLMIVLSSYKSKRGAARTTAQKIRVFSSGYNLTTIAALSRFDPLWSYFKLTATAWILDHPTGMNRLNHKEKTL